MVCIKCGKEIPEGAPYCCWCGKKQKQEPRKTLKRANGTGSVYKLSGRRTRPWVAAKNKLVIGYYAKKTDALDALSRLVGKDISERYNMTFSDIYEGWKFEHYREIGQKSIDGYENAYKNCESLYDRKFRELRTRDFQEIVDLHNTQSRSTQAKYKNLFTQLSEWAMREEIVTTNYAGYVKLSGEKAKEKDIFSADDITKLEADGSSAAKVVLMLIYTGMRIGELFEAKTENYHETYLIGGKKTKAGRDRIIPIRAEGRGYFAELAERATGELLISGRDGQKTAENYRKREYYPLLERLGIARKTPHATRHTFASWAVAAGMRTDILQKIIGHANYSTTAEIYVHADAEELVGAVETARNLLATETKQRGLSRTN
jgi:integrase